MKSLDTMNYKDAKKLFDSLNEEVNKIRLISNPTNFQNDPAFSKLIYLREEVRKLLEIVPAHRVKSKVFAVPTLNANGKFNEELTAAQKRLPPGLQKAIAAKQGKVEEEKEEVVEHDDGTPHEHNADGSHPDPHRTEPKSHLKRIWPEFKRLVTQRITGDLGFKIYTQAAEDVGFADNLDLKALLDRVLELHNEKLKVGENMEHPKSSIIEQLMPLFEQDLDQAELVLAAKDMGDRLQKMAEDLASMQVEDLMPLVAAMKEQMGPEKAGAFESSADTAISGALESVKSAKESHDNAVLALQGEAPPETDMDMEEPAPDMGGEISMDEPAPEMEIGDEEAMAGPEGEPEGREIKAEESVQFLNKAKNILRAYKTIGKLDETALEEAQSVLKGK